MGKPNKNNKTKQLFLNSVDSLEKITFDGVEDLITISFKYFCVNQVPVGQVFSDWKENMRLDLFQNWLSTRNIVELIGKMNSATDCLF